MAQFPHKVLNQPGIRRDGTELEGNEWSDGQWVRFDRGRPRKMRGYKSISKALTNPSRQLISQTSSGNSYVHSGHVSGVDEFTISSTGSVSQSQARTPTAFVADPNISWQFATIFDPTSVKQQLIGVPTYTLLDPTNTTVGNGIMNQTTGNASNIYTGPMYDTTTMIAMTLAPNGTGAATESATTTGVSGGVCVLNPYTILYGANGYFAWSTPTAPLDFRGAGSGSANITAQKLIRGMPLRGGAGYSPAGLFWSVDSLIRVTYTQAIGTVWQYDVLSDEISVLNGNCIVQSDGIFYWAGADGRFYMYNGVVQEILNELNLNWFYDGINSAYAGKCFAFRNPRWGEIWWCYPRGSATECTHAVIYNYRKKVWYDTMLPAEMRSFGILGDNNLGVIMSGASNNGGGSTANISGVAVGTTTTLTTSAAHGFAVGNTVKLTNVGGIPALSGTFTITAVPLTTTFTVAVNTVGATYTSGGLATLQLFTLWQHDVGTDAVDGQNAYAIDSYIETTPITLFSSDKPTFESLSASALESDFVISGNMTVTVRGQSSASSPNVDSAPYPIYAVPNAATTQITPLKETRRQMRLRFESNVAGGDFQMGDCWLHLNTDGKRMTT